MSMRWFGGFSQMMTADVFLADTNVVSMLWDELHNDHDVAWDFLRSYPDASVYISVITLGELEYGLQTAPRIDAKRQIMIRDQMKAFPLVLNITRHTINHYAEMRAALFRRFSPRDKRGRLTAKVPEDLVDCTTGRELGIDENDLWIASLAVERNLVFLSRDKMNRIRKVSPQLRFKYLMA